MTEKEKKSIEQLKAVYESQSMTENQKEELQKKLKEAKKESCRKKFGTWKNVGAAAAVAVLILLVVPNVSASAAYAMQNIPLFGKLVKVITFRDYQYENENKRQSADIKVPELVVGEETVVENTQDDDVMKNAEAADGAENAEAGDSAESTEGSDSANERLKKTTEEINAEIETIAAGLMKEFEENLDDIGYQDISMDYKVLNTAEEYFTLQILCYQAASSGYQWEYYYTIDLNTGERLALKDLFADGADYITPISENIKEQMRAQMAEDENIMYWIDYDEVPEWNFNAITDETNFYLNEKGELVISFNEGDAAPMYMGVVSFTIPEDVISDIRK